MTRNEMRDWIGGCMKQKGFHDDFGDFAAEAMERAFLIDTENVEAGQEVKRHWKDSVPESVRDQIAKECADTAIRLYDFAFLFDLDLELDDAELVSKPRDIGRNERQRLMIRCGKVVSIVGGLFDVFEDLYDFANEIRMPAAVVFRDADYDFQAMAIGQVAEALVHCESLCEKVGRDLNKAIEAKMAENMARPHKYGTPDAAKPTAGTIKEDQLLATVSPGLPDHPQAITVELGNPDSNQKLKDAKEKVGQYMAENPEPPIGGETVLNNKIQNILSRLQAGEVVTVVVDGCGSTCNSLTECSQQIEVVANASDSVSTPGD